MSMPIHYFELPLFRGITVEEQHIMRDCGCMHRQAFEKNQPIYHAGEQVSAIGIVLSGSVLVENTDFWGNRSILSHVTPGQVFAETYALCREPLMVNVTARESTEILFLDLNRMPQLFQANAAWQSKIMENLLRISVQKNLLLSHRIFCTTPKTIRGRLLIYLSAQATKAGSTSFQIPFDRQGLADYLNLDRSALSKELGRMQKEGILDFHKNQFTLHQTPDF